MRRRTGDPSGPFPGQRSLDLGAVAKESRRSQDQPVAREGKEPLQGSADPVGDERRLDVVEDDAGPLVQFEAARVSAVSPRGLGTLRVGRIVLAPPRGSSASHELEGDMSGLGVEEEAIRSRPEVRMVHDTAVRKAIADILQTPDTEIGRA